MVAANGPNCSPKAGAPKKMKKTLTICGTSRKNSMMTRTGTRTGAGLSVASVPQVTAMSVEKKTLAPKI